MEKCWLEGSFQRGLDCFVVNNCYVGIFYLEGKLKLSHVILKFSWAKLEARFEFSLIMEKLWDTQINTRIYWNRSFAVSDLFIWLQSIKFYTFHCHILKNIDVWKRWFINETENKLLLLSVSFTYLSWVLSELRETLFLTGFILKSTEKA